MNYKAKKNKYYSFDPVYKDSYSTFSSLDQAKFEAIRSLEKLKKTSDPAVQRMIDNLIENNLVDFDIEATIDGTYRINTKVPTIDYYDYESSSLYDNDFIGNDYFYDPPVTRATPIPVVETEEQKRQKQCFLEVEEVIGFWQDWIQEKSNGKGKVTGEQTSIQYVDDVKGTNSFRLFVSTNKINQQNEKVTFVFLCGKKEDDDGGNLINELEMPHKLFLHKKEKLIEEAWHHFISIRNVEENSRAKFLFLENEINKPTES